ncbi:hypothetical protein [Actinoplanes sp. URMC 104]|uniref:hypothetical protein n=1 Tax=Actinoplanes sp. URMC 104 TaxID=3423409 RepID=UPI003F1E0FBC
MSEQPNPQRPTEPADDATTAELADYFTLVDRYVEALCTPESVERSLREAIRKASERDSGLAPDA